MAVSPGIRRREALALAQSGNSLAALRASLQDKGRSWKIDQDVVERAASSAAGAFAHIRDAHLLEGPITMAASYDDVDLVVDLEYEGRLLTVPDLDGPSPDLTEEAPFSEGLTRFLSGIHADRAETSSKERRARVRLYFAT